MLEIVKFIKIIFFLLVLFVIWDVGNDIFLILGIFLDMVVINFGLENIIVVFLVWYKFLFVWIFLVNIFFGNKFFLYRLI